jgi:hypothetical protein
MRVAYPYDVQVAVEGDDVITSRQYAYDPFEAGVQACFQINASRGGDVKLRVLSIAPPMECWQPTIADVSIINGGIPFAPAVTAGG